MSAVTARAVNWTETGLVPDTVIRAGIRRLLERKLREIHAGDVEQAADILSTVDLLDGFRAWFEKKFPGAAKLATCKYCQCFWLSAVAGFFLPLPLVSGLFGNVVFGFAAKWFFLWFAISRLANFADTAFAVISSAEDFLRIYVEPSLPDGTNGPEEASSGTLASDQDQGQSGT